MAYEAVEQFRILFLDKKNMLIADEVQQSGTVDHTPVYPREVVKRALELSATAIILVHNHPSGDPTPSRADIQMTKSVVDIATPLGITVHDHIIVGKNGHASFKGLKLMLGKRSGSIPPIDADFLLLDDDLDLLGIDGLPDLADLLAVVDALPGAAETIALDPPGTVEDGHLAGIGLHLALARLVRGEHELARVACARSAEVDRATLG